MTEMFHFWHVEKAHTTTNHPQADDVVDQNDRKLGDSLQALPLGGGQEKQDMLLSQLIKT